MCQCQFDWITFIEATRIQKALKCTSSKMYTDTFRQNNTSRTDFRLCDCFSTAQCNNKDFCDTKYFIYSTDCRRNYHMIVMYLIFIVMEFKSLLLLKNYLLGAPWLVRWFFDKFMFSVIILVKSGRSHKTH